MLGKYFLDSSSFASSECVEHNISDGFIRSRFMHAVHNMYRVHMYEKEKTACLSVSTDPKHFRSVGRILNLYLLLSDGEKGCLLCSDSWLQLLFQEKAWKTDSSDYYWENMPVAWMLRRVWPHMKQDVMEIRPDEMTVENTATCTGLILGGVKMWGGLK